MKIVNNPNHGVEKDWNQPDLIDLQRDLKEKINNFNHTIKSALESPDKIDHAMCQHFSETILSLHNLCKKINSSQLPKTDLARSLQEAANTIEVLNGSVFDVETN
jgi:hypothetical protein